jgi:integrase
VEGYALIARSYVNPHLGAMQLQKLKPIALTEFYAKLLREGGHDGRKLSSRSVGNVHRLLHAALAHAVKWGLITANPADNVSAPRTESPEVEIPDAAGIAALLARLRDKSLYMTAVLGLATGMRRGEMLALRWRDIDAGKITVARSLEQSKAGGLRFKSTKTRSGKRTITIPPSVVAELRRYRLEQQERWLALGLGKVRDDGLVLATWTGGTRSPNSLSRNWHEKVPEVTLHALRHTHASQLIAAGVDVVTVAARLGHAKPSVTLNTYAHLYGSTDDRAADIMQATFAHVGGE